MKAKKARYQKGSIKRVRRAHGYAWEVRFNDWKDGKRYQRTLTFDGAQYRTEKDVRKAIELNVSQINSGTVGAMADAKFNAGTHSTGQNRCRNSSTRHGKSMNIR